MTARSECVCSYCILLFACTIVTNSTRSRRSPYGSGLVSTPSTPGPSGSFDCRTDGRELVFGWRDLNQRIDSTARHAAAIPRLSVAGIAAAMYWE